jgi:hypothetical protein
MEAIAPNVFMVWPDQWQAVMNTNYLWVTYNPGSSQENAAGIVNIQHSLNNVINI